jgi:hypothetical protein
MMARKTILLRNNRLNHILGANMVTKPYCICLVLLIISCNKTSKKEIFVPASHPDDFKVDLEDDDHCYWKKYVGNSVLQKRFDPNNSMNPDKDFIYLYPVIFKSTWSENNIDCELANERFLSWFGFGTMLDKYLSEQEIDWPDLKGKDLKKWWSEKYLPVIKVVFSEYTFPNTFNNMDIERMISTEINIKSPTSNQKRLFYLSLRTLTANNFNTQVAEDGLKNDFTKVLKSKFVFELKKQGLIK